MHSAEEIDGPARRLIGKRPQRRLTTCFYRPRRTALRRPSESALGAIVTVVVGIIKNTMVGQPAK
jgi:hypothetical protein